MDWFFMGSLFYLLLPSAIAVIAYKIISCQRAERELLARARTISTRYVKVRAVIEDIGFDVDWTFPGRTLPDGADGEAIAAEILRRHERVARDGENVLAYSFVWKGSVITSDRIALATCPEVRHWLLGRRVGEQIIAYINPADPEDCFVYINPHTEHLWRASYPTLGLSLGVALVSLIGVLS